MKPEKLTLTMHVGIEITLWQAIKLRIAGKHLREYLDMMLKECLVDTPTAEASGILRQTSGDA